MLLIYHVLNLCLVSNYLVLSLNQMDLTVLNLIGTVKLEENVWKRRWKLSCTYRAIPRFDVMVCYCASVAELKCGAMDALWPFPWKLVWSCLSTLNTGTNDFLRWSFKHLAALKHLRKRLSSIFCSLNLIFFSFFSQLSYWVKRCRSFVIDNL